MSRQGEVTTLAEAKASPLDMLNSVTEEEFVEAIDEAGARSSFAMPDLG